MAVYIGVDLHVRTETVCWMNTADGEIHQHTLDHSRDDLRAFYAQFTAPAVVGIESSGYALWFHQLMEQAGHRLLVGDATRFPSCTGPLRPARTPWRCCAIATGWCACAPW